MYEQFFRLSEDPFRLSADPRFCFSHKSYAKAKAYMQFALQRAEGFVMITGRPGTGKTTLIRDLVAGLDPARIKVATLVSTQLEAEDLLRMSAHAFGVDARAPHKALVLQQLIDFLARQDQHGRRALLIIDEAQDLAPSALEELRLLTNIQHGNRPLMQVFLAGQEPLRGLVRNPDMEQVHQRLVAAWHLEPLSPPETIGYVRHRLETAGWQGDPTIKRGVFPLIHAFSQGVPRRINLVCSRLLLHAFINDSHTITANDAHIVVLELEQESLAPLPLDARSMSSDDGHPAALRVASNTPDGISSGAERAASPDLDNDWSMIDQGLTANPDSAARNAPPPAPPSPDPAAAPPAMPAEPVAMAPLQPTAAIAPPIAAIAGPPDANTAPPANPPDWSTAAEPGVEAPMATGTRSTRSGHGLSQRAPRRAPRWVMVVVVLGAGAAAAMAVWRPALFAPLAELLPSQARNWLNESLPAPARQWLNSGIAAPRARLESDQPAATEPAAPQSRPPIAPAQPSRSRAPANATQPRDNAQTAAIPPPDSDRPGAAMRPADATESGAPAASQPAPVQPEPQPTQAPVFAPKPEADFSTGAESADTNPALGVSDAGAATASPVDAFNARPGKQSGPGPAKLQATEIQQPNPARISGAAPEVAAAKPAEHAGASVATVLFGWNSTEVQPRFQAELQRLADRLRRSPDLSAEVVGYSDSGGNPDYNLELSRQRARAVRDYLVAQRVPEARIQVLGLGPRGTSTAVNPQANDRLVEVRVAPAKPLGATNPDDATD